MSRKISEKEISQTINLRGEYGREPSSLEKAAFQQEAIELIISRTQGGEDINGKKFPNYTEEYADEKGVSVSDVDLTDFGDMLLGIEATDSSSGIELKMAASQTAKAHGNITGSYGRPSPDSKKARDFFGLSNKEISEIAQSVKVDSVDSSLSIASLFQEESEINIDDILQNIGILVG